MFINYLNLFRFRVISIVVSNICFIRKFISVRYQGHGRPVKPPLCTGSEAIRDVYLPIRSKIAGKRTRHIDINLPLTLNRLTYSISDYFLIRDNLIKPYWIVLILSHSPYSGFYKNFRDCFFLNSNTIKAGVVIKMK